MEIVEKRFLSLPKVKEQFLNVDPEIGSLWLETVDKVAELSSQNQGFVFPERLECLPCSRSPLADLGGGGGGRGGRGPPFRLGNSRLSRLWREVALSPQLLRPPVSEFPGSAPDHDQNCGKLR